MNCPVCKTSTLTDFLLETGLTGKRCTSCKGIWVSSLDYFSWLRGHGPAELVETADPGDEMHLPTWELPIPKICPDCGHLLTRYKIWPQVEFYLDHCGSCNGMWFDRNEWQVLEEIGMHDKLNLFFTRPWQRRLREQETRQILEKVYLEKFGEADYARIREIRAWLLEHPRRGMLLAYLQSEDPYKAS